jgi:asparagine synthetase B (glutamine-hydrolysing)
VWVPNLVGIHDPRAKGEDLSRDLDRMMAAVDLPSFRFEKRRAFGPGIACGNVLTGVENNLLQPAKDEARGLWLMLDGEILSSAELAAELRIDAREVDDAHVALAMYIRHGSSFFERLNGQWNIVLCDPAERYTLLISDRIGSRILFYAEDEGRLTFASEVKAVIAGRARKTRPGGIGMLGILAGGTCISDTTWFEDIKVVSPGTVIRLRDGERRRHRYHKLHFRETGPEKSEDAYAAEFGRLLRVATERCMRHRPGHPVAITLSGGLDSRSVALAIDRSRLPITSITYGSPESPDGVYAKQLAELIGLDHHHIEELWPGLVEQSDRLCDRLLGPSPSGKRGFYSSQIDRAAWRSEAMSALNGVASTIWHPLYRRYMRVMLNGACGDAMTGSHLVPELLLGPTRSEVMAGLVRRTLVQHRDLLELILAKEFYAQHAPWLEAELAKTFDDIDADEPCALSNVWDMENRQRRGTFASFTIERYFCTCRSPYLDYELVDLLASVPPRWRFQQRIYKRMLVTEFPEAKHVPWAYTRGRITKSPTYEFLREAFNFSKGRLERMLPRRSSRMAHWLFRDEVTMLRDDADLAVQLERFARAEWFPSHVFSAKGVLDFVQRFRAGAGDSETATLYAHLVGMSKCIELFLGQDELKVTPAADPASFGVDTSA